MDPRRCLKDLETTAKCPHCSATLKEPKTLPCLHSFCLLCLDNLARIARRRLDEEISCPICQTRFPIPEGNTFSDLPTSFHLDRFKDILAVLSKGNQPAKTCKSCNEGHTAISYCFVCKDLLCLRCDKAHRRLRVTRDHSYVLLQNVTTQAVEDLLQGSVKCAQKNHENETINRFCTICHQCICQICYAESHWRHMFAIADIQQAAQGGKEQIKDAVKEAEEEIVTCEDELKENAEILESSKEEIDEARRNVKAIIKELINSLKEHEKAVLMKVDDIYEQHQQDYGVRQRELQMLITRLRRPVEHGKHVLRRNMDVEIAKEKEAIVDRCEDLRNSKDKFELPFVNYVVDEEMCQNVCVSGPGKLIVSHTDPVKSKARGDGLRDPVVGIKTTILVRTIDSRGNQCYHEDDQVKVKIQSPQGEQLETVFKDDKGGQYKVRFTPKFVGQHNVIINVNGQPLSDSPWNVQVTPHQYQIAFKLGTKAGRTVSSWQFLLNEDKKLSLPQGIAISQVNGNVAVLDLSEIKLFDADGKYLREFGARCSGKRLRNPQSVAFSSSGDILVVDRDNITQCTEQGIFVRHFKKHAKSPSSLSVARDGRVIVCDDGNVDVNVLSPNGEELLQRFGDPYLYDSPSFAIYYKRKFFVSYRENHRVVVFSDNGTFLYDIGAQVDDEAKLNGPLGLAIDKFNNLLICESDSSQVKVFTLEGRYVTTISGYGSPQFVAASNNGQLYVTDGGMNCVYVLN